MAHEELNKDFKVCVSTFVWGEMYQEFLPIAIYSMHKMYPQYEILIFLYGSLSLRLKQILIKLNVYDKVRIKENAFSDCPNMNKYKAQTLRWVLWDDSFYEYDYLYIIDIDMFYIREPMPLHEQHILHMQKTQLPFDNMRRVAPPTVSSFRDIIINILIYVKYFKIRYLPDYLLFYKNGQKRISGLHFIDVKKYYQILSPHVLLRYKKMIYDGSYVKKLHVINDEAFLYEMLKHEGLDVDKLAAQNYKTHEHMDFNNYEKDLFRPIHGIHLGDFRTEHLDVNRINSILATPSQIYYKDYIKNYLLNNRDFIYFFNLQTDRVKEMFRRYFRYSDLKFDF